MRAYMVKPRGRTEISDFRDDETLRVSNHLSPRYFTRIELTSLHNDTDAAHNTVTQITVTPPCTRDACTDAGFIPYHYTAVIPHHSAALSTHKISKTCLFIHRLG